MIIHQYAKKYDLLMASRKNTDLQRSLSSSAKKRANSDSTSIHTYVERSYYYGEERTMLELVRVK